MHDTPTDPASPLRIGSLFSGYGGLDLAVEHVFGGETVWFSEINEPVARVFAHHWPDAPNLGDITRISWSQVEPVDMPMCAHRPERVPGARPARLPTVDTSWQGKPPIRSWCDSSGDVLPTSHGVGIASPAVKMSSVSDHNVAESLCLLSEPSGPWSARSMIWCDRRPRSLRWVSGGGVPDAVILRS